jgi:hypothetical protein
MVIFEAAFVLAVLGLITYATIRLLTRSQEERPPVSLAGHWRVAHHDVKGETHVVLRKHALGSGKVLDEHVIATVRVDDPDYDAKFLAAMSAARERRALFEAEDEP